MTTRVMPPAIWVQGRPDETRSLARTARHRVPGRGHVPQPQRLVVADTGKVLAVRGKGERGHDLVVAFEFVQLLSVADVEQGDDVQHLDGAAEVRDVRIEARAHAAQILADLELLLLKALDLLLLLGRQDHRGAVIAPRLQRRQFVLGRAQLGLELLLLRTEALIGAGSATSL